MANKDNPATGRKFEELVKRIIEKKIGVDLEKGLLLDLGIDSKKTKPHRFDLGNREKKIIIECKSHSWTNTGNVPSAKMSVWNEAMYYFFLAPKDYKKILCVKKHNRSKRNNNETLSNYYIRTYNYLIPNDVEIYEIDTENEIYNDIRTQSLS